MVSTNRTFNFPSPVSFHAWHGDAAIAHRLLSEWGWIIERREPANSEALAQFLTSAPEPGTTEDREQALLSRWHGWHVLVTYFSFGALREIYSNYPIPIIEFTLPAGSDLNQLGDAPDFYLDLMIDQCFYFAYVRNGVLWRDQMQDELNGDNKGHFVLRGNEGMSVEWLLDVTKFPGYGFQNSVVFSSSLGLNLRGLGLPLQHWQNRDQDIVNEVLDISH